MSLEIIQYDILLKEEKMAGNSGRWSHRIGGWEHKQ